MSRVPLETQKAVLPNWNCGSYNNLFLRGGTLVGSIFMTGSFEIQNNQRLFLFFLLKYKLLK